jgi:hypothetical protein
VSALAPHPGPALTHSRSSRCCARNMEPDQHSASRSLSASMPWYGTGCSESGARDGYAMPETNCLLLATSIVSAQAFRRPKVGRPINTHSCRAGPVRHNDPARLCQRARDRARHRLSSRRGRHRATLASSIFYRNEACSLALCNPGPPTRPLDGTTSRHIGPRKPLESTAY